MRITFNNGETAIISGIDNRFYPCFFERMLEEYVRFGIARVECTRDAETFVTVWTASDGIVAENAEAFGVTDWFGPLV